MGQRHITVRIVLDAMDAGAFDGTEPNARLCHALAEMVKCLVRNYEDLLRQQLSRFQFPGFVKADPKGGGGQRDIVAVEFLGGFAHCALHVKGQEAARLLAHTLRSTNGIIPSDYIQRGLGETQVNSGPA